MLGARPDAPKSARRSAFQDRYEFLDRPFLAKLRNAYKFAIEIRNRNWLDAEVARLLRNRGIDFVRDSGGAHEFHRNQ